MSSEHSKGVVNMLWSPTQNLNKIRPAKVRALEKASREGTITFLCVLGRQWRGN